MKMMTKTAFTLSPAAAALFAAGRGKADEHSKPAGPSREIRNVSTATITRSSNEDFYDSTGTAKARTAT